MDVKQLFCVVPDMTVDGKWWHVRNYRNQLLAECDWTQSPDAVLTFDERAAWAEYRQALRDLPNNFTDPDLVVFPEMAK